MPIPTPEQKAFLERKITATQGRHPDSRNPKTWNEVAGEIGISAYGLRKLLEKDEDGQYLRERGCRRGTWQGIVDAYPEILWAGDSLSDISLDAAVRVIEQRLPPEPAKKIKTIVYQRRKQREVTT